MKAGWEYKSLGDVCEILDSRRKPITKNKRESGTIPYYGATGILDYVKDYIFDEKLVLLGEDGAKWGAGENSAYIVEGKTWVNNHAHTLRPKREHLIDELLVYYLNFANLQPFITGVTVPKLNQEKMRSIEIPVPPLSEQQSIVDYLDSAFAKIDAMKANAEKALNEAKALFQASLKEMLEPKEGWEEKTINDVALFRNGIAHEKDIEDGGNYIVINSKFVATEGTIRKYADKQLSPLYTNEIVMVMSDVPKGKTLAKCYIIECDNKYSLNQRICAFKSKGLDTRLLYYMLNRNPNLLKYDNGENQTNLRKNQILECPVAYPTQINEQQNIVNNLDTLKLKVGRLQENYDKISQECDALKQAILRQVFE